MLKKKPLSVAVATALGVVSASGALTNVAFAADEAMMEEVVVTGSRIKRQDFESNAPVATVGSDQIDLTGTVNTESLLNTLPQTVPGLDRTSNNPGNGTASVDLRGLGSNRTLVLMDGTRVVPTSGGGSVDINNIPTALIDRVEVLTGGASAIYGSDAVAGVVNFILKDDFEGVQFNIGAEQTTESDAELYSADLTLGVNSGDGRGNLVMNISWTDRKELFQGDRDFAFFAQFDDTDANGNPILIDGGSSGIPGTSIFAGALGGFSPSFGATFDPDGSIRPFRTGATNDFYNYAPVNYIQLPQERHQATVLGRYEIAESAEVYSRVLFTQSRVPQQLAPTPIFQTTSFTVDGSPFLDANAQQVLSDAFGDGVDTDGDGVDDTATAFVRRRLEEVGPRIADSSYTSWQLNAGVRGDIGDTSWSYDAYVSKGSAEGSETQLGNVNRDRFNQALLLDLTDPTGNTCADTSANGSTSGCAPINIFGAGNISAAGAAFLRTAVAAAVEYDQEIYSVSFAGDLFELPAGTIGAAIGYEHIENSFDFRPSQDLAAGTIAGFNGSPATSGRTSVESFFGELYVPLLRDAPLANELDLELAFRSADYDTVGGVDSYKVAGSWAPIESVRFRAGFNTAVRAPSIGELFSPVSEGFPGSTDPCAAEGANAGDPAVQAICIATGVPANQVNTPAINLAAGQVRQLGGGNPLLEEEEAETLTVGIVVTPTFVDGLTFSIDRFDIEIEEYIASFGGGANNVLNICYDPTNPFGGIGSPFCNVVNRRPDGTIDNVAITAQNVAVQTLKGWDILATYNRELLGGDFQVSYIGTMTDEDDFTAFAGDTPITCDGEFGNDCGEPRPDYKHRMTFNWSRDAWTVQLLWRHIGEVDDDDEATTYFADDIDSEDYFDMVASYDFTENYSVTFGIDNVADTEPPILGDNQEQANTWPATYDVFGRTYYVKATARF